ncbi:hypothetical protein VTN77DRAFT_8932 [Rasamsonia byssochlamydoides]|uniref:uncharacterized protein n=1 Tax=Rasamsonia byssochlamydoides TaxID=89139 RepID=UPI003743A92D
MSSEESPAQQAARLRRERREAKIRASGTARLEKITSLSGRTVASESESPSPAPRPVSPAVAVSEPTEQPRPSPSPMPPASKVEDQSPENIQAQQEYLRALLRAHPPEQQQQQKIDEDPTMKLLSAMLGGLPGGENTAPGSGAANLSPSDLTSALGLPPFLSKLLLGGGSQPQTPEEQKREWIWKLLHVFFALAIGVYLLVLIGSSVATYGSQPPPPATAQNPFVIFMTGELLLNGAKMLLASRQDGQLGNLATWTQLVRNLARDGSIAVFVLGVGSWWNGGWQASGST